MKFVKMDYAFPPIRLRFSGPTMRQRRAFLKSHGVEEWSFLPRESIDYADALCIRCHLNQTVVVQAKNRRAEFIPSRELSDKHLVNVSWRGY